MRNHQSHEWSIKCDGGGENVIPTILLHQQKLMLNQVKYTQ